MYTVEPRDGVRGLDWVTSQLPFGETNTEKKIKDCEYYVKNIGKHYYLLLQFSWTIMSKGKGAKLSRRRFVALLVFLV